jgi:hypothetical protein
MKNIGITKGFMACVDDTDYEWLSAFRWSANIGDGGKVYPIACVAGVNHYMHRVILGLGKRKDDKRVVDHIDGDTLNNTRANLRICTPSQNAMNSRKPKNSTSRYKGVQVGNGKWTASINSDRQKFFLGTFDNEVLAAICYNQKARELHKQFAWLNPIHCENEILGLLSQIRVAEAKIAELVEMELKGSL